MCINESLVLINFLLYPIIDETIIYIYIYMKAILRAPIQIGLNKLSNCSCYTQELIIYKTTLTMIGIIQKYQRKIF